MLTKEQLEQYHEDGFVIVRDFFAPDDLQPVLEWIDELVDNLANHLYEAGKIQNSTKTKGSTHA